MAGTIVVCGHGPGISDAVAKKFGNEGYAVALVARSAEKLTRAAQALGEAGVRAAAFPTDLADSDAVATMIARVRETLGPIAVLHYNAYASGAGELLTASADALRAPFDVSVVGLVAAVRAAREDLVAAKGSLLVTGGGLAFYDPKIDAMAAQWGAMGLAVAKAAQHKAVGLLAAKLGPEGVYVGEVVVTGLVKGTAFDSGHASLDPHDIAAKFWELHRTRSAHSVTFG